MRGFLVLISGLNIFSSDHRQGEGVDVSNLLPTIQMTLEGGIRLWLTSLCLLHGSYLCVGSHGICCCLEHLLCCLQVVIIWPHLWYHWTTFNYPLLCMWCWVNVSLVPGVHLDGKEVADSGSTSKVICLPVVGLLLPIPFGILFIYWAMWLLILVSIMNDRSFHDTQKQVIDC